MPNEQEILQSKISAMESLAKTIPGGLSEGGAAELDGLKKQLSANPNPAEPNPAEPKPAEPKPAEPKPAEPKPVSGDNKIVITKKKLGTNPNPLLAAAEATEEQRVIASMDDMIAYFKEAGVEPAEVLADIPVLSEKAKQADELQKKLADFSALVESLPEPIFAAAKAFWTNQDWKPMLKSFKEIDYTVDVNQVSAVDLVSMFYEDQITADSIEQDSPAFKALVEAAKVKYSAKQKEVKDVFDRASRIEQETKEKREKSLDASIQRLKSDPIFGAIPQDQISNLRDQVLRGMLNDEFFTPDGGFREDAAEKVLILKYGKDVISSKLKEAENAAGNKTVEEIIRAQEAKRAQEAAAASGGGSQQNEAVRKLLAGMSSLNSGSSFEHIDKKK